MKVPGCELLQHGQAFVGRYAESDRCAFKFVVAEGEKGVGGKPRVGFVRLREDKSCRGLHR
jgi:hypothetical protein